MKTLLTLLLATFAASAFAEEKFCSIPVPNAGFEDGTNCWRLGSGFTLAEGAGRNGSRAIRWAAAELTKNGSGLSSAKVKVRPGQYVTYSGWVRLGEKLANGPVYFHATATDANGKWLDGVEGRPLIRQPQLKGKGWVQVTGALPRLPRAAAFVNVSVGCPKNMSGEIFVDDFTISASEPQYVEYVYSSAYRDTAPSGKVKFAAPYILDPADGTDADLAPAFVYTDAQGREKTVNAEVTKDASFVATLDVGDFKQGPGEVRAVLRKKDGKILGTASLAFVRAPLTQKIHFDARRRTIVDGKPFLPLGMYGAGKMSEESLAKFREAPFNCLFVSARKADLDFCQAHGMKAIVGMTGIYDPAALARRVGDYKDHPAVLAWYTNDEIPPGFARRQAMLQEVFRKVDPDHPTWTVLDKPWQVRKFLTSFDVIGMDPYPVGNHRGGIDIALGWAQECDREAYGMRPMWQVPQAFNWRWYRDGLDEPEFRFPRPDEFRSMMWQAIAAGANGLIPYSYAAIHRQMKDPAELAAAWKSVRETVCEIAAQTDVILFDGDPVEVKGAPDKVGVRTWSADGTTFVLVANALRKQAAFKLALPFAVKTVSARIGNAPKVENGTELKFDMAALDVALVEIRGK